MDEKRNERGYRAINETFVLKRGGREGMQRKKLGCRRTKVSTLEEEEEEEHEGFTAQCLPRRGLLRGGDAQPQQQERRNNGAGTAAPHCVRHGQRAQRNRPAQGEAALWTNNAAPQEAKKAAAMEK